MRHSARVLLAAVGVLVLVQTAWPASVGGKAPDFTLKDLTGTPHTLSKYRGKVVLVDFWASWCPPCKRSIPEIDMLYRKYKDEGLVVLAINVDKDRRSIDRFLKNFSLEVPILLDPEADVVSAYRILGMPTSMIVDKDGVIRSIHVSYTADTISEYVSEIKPLLGQKP